MLMKLTPYMYTKVIYDNSRQIKLCEQEKNRNKSQVVKFEQVLNIFCN